MSIYSYFDLADAITEIVDRVYSDGPKAQCEMFATRAGFNAELRIGAEIDEALSSVDGKFAEALLAKTLRECGCVVEFGRVRKGCVTRTLSVATSLESGPVVDALCLMKAERKGIFARLESPRLA